MEPMPRSARILVALAPLLATLPAGAALAQEGGTPVGGDPQQAVGIGGTQTTTTYQQQGVPGPGVDLESHLGSGSHATTDTTNSTDGFDYNKRGTASAGSKGNKDGQYVLEGGAVPQSHTVKRGDTLWSISGQYYNSPYKWPQLWAQNPQILNPHWIYPGDRLRLRDTNFRIGGSDRAVAPETIFLRDYGWVDDPDRDTWGELVGSPSEHMIVDNEIEVYIQLDDDVKVELGDELSIFRVLKTWKGEEADAPGELVSVRGTVVVDKINNKTHIARARITETIDTIERGALVGRVARKFAVVPPVTNEKYVEARIMTSVYPHAFFGGNQIVFLDRGEKDGVQPGNRFLAVERVDKWVQNLGGAGYFGSRRPLVEDDKPGQYDQLKIDGPIDDYPDELYAEIRVISVRDHTCMAIVTESAYEVERDAVLIMKKGF